MKKPLALLLAMVMAFSLFACAKTPAPAADTATPPAPATAAPTAAATADNGGAATVDHFNRAPFKIAYICNLLTWAWNSALDDALSKYGKKLNYEYTSWAANRDFDAYVNQIYVYADMGYDGVVLGLSDEISQRCYEVCRETGIAFVAESTAFMDETGLCIWPSVQQANYANAELCVNWLSDHYTDYWKSAIDVTKLGMLCLDYSVVSGITERTPGVTDTFKKLFPAAANNVFVGDLVTYGPTGFSVQGGNDMATSIFASHPEIEHWFVVANVDDWATGATRAAEALKMEDRVLITSIQADAFLKEMESGYTGGVYVAASAISSIEFAIQMATCLVTILEGRETPETIWPEWRDPGGQYPRYQIMGTMITRDTYKAYLEGEQAKLA